MSGLTQCTGAGIGLPDRLRVVDQTFTHRACAVLPPPSDGRWQLSPCCVVHGPLPRCGSSTCRGTSQGVVLPVLGVLDRVLGVLVVIVIIIIVVIIV